MKKKKKQMIVVNVSEVKTRSAGTASNPTHVYRPRKRYIVARDAERKKSHECL